jgi:hypothetical protein
MLSTTTTETGKARPSPSSYPSSCPCNNRVPTAKNEMSNREDAMVDNYFIPQKITMPAPKNRTKATEQEMIQEVMRGLLPEFFNYLGDTNLNITVHIHCCNHPVLPAE